MSLNNIITSVNALANNVVIPETDINNVVCIDTLNNRLGIKTNSPAYEIDVSGDINCNNLLTNQIQNNIYFTNEIENENKIEISGNTIFKHRLDVDGDVSLNSNVEISGNVLMQNNLIVNSNAEISGNVLMKNNLEVNGDISLNNNVFIAGDLDISGRLRFLNADNLNNLEISGGILVGTVNGDAPTSTTVITSDDRLKHNEQNILNGLEIIRQLVPQIYQKTQTFKEADFSGIVTEPYIIEAGLIAQEVLNITDLSFTVVVGDETKPYAVNYTNIFVYLIAALKELDSKFTKYSNENMYLPEKNNVNLGNIENLVKSQNLLIQTLNSKIQSLENRIKTLENK